MAATDIAKFMAAPERSIFVVHVRDRFGDYGLVGAFLASKNGAALRVDSLLLSCRALGRGVEYDMASSIAGHAVSSGCSWVEIPFVKTGRNEPAAAFLKRLAYSCHCERAEDGSVRLPARELKNAEFSPVKASVDAHPNTAEERPAASRNGDFPARDNRVLSVAESLDSAEAVFTDIRQWRLRRNGSRQPARDTASAAAPQSDMEDAIADIWNRTLAISDVGTGDNFFEIGGTSLLLAQVAIELKRSGLNVSIIDLFQYPTIAALARHLGDPGIRKEKLGSVAAAAQRQRNALKSFTRMKQEKTGKP